MPSRDLPREITTYDLLKSAAVILMIVDHLGYYLYPDNLWLRVAGRLCVPVWFFLIGYARSRDLGPALWIGMIVLLAGDMLAGMTLLPVNVLGSMIVVRLVIDPLMRFALSRAARLWQVSLLLLLLLPPTYYLWEYGTQAVIMAMYGYLIRHRDHLKNPDRLIPQFLCFAFISFAGSQWFFFGMDQAQGMVLGLGCAIVMGLLYFFRPGTLPRLTAAVPRPVVALLHFTGRHTLLIYVVHLLIFKALGVDLEPHRFVMLHWHWISMSGT